MTCSAVLAEIGFGGFVLRVFAFGFFDMLGDPFGDVRADLDCEPLKLKLNPLKESGLGLVLPATMTLPSFAPRETGGIEPGSSGI